MTLERQGNVGSLPRAVDRTAFRILQEALTNAAKHGDGTWTRNWCGDDGRLEITVHNRLRSPVPEEHTDHHGIVGMRERAVLFGGTLEAGAATAPTRCGPPARWSETAEPLQTVSVLFVDDDDLMRVGLRGDPPSDDGHRGRRRGVGTARAALEAGEPAAAARGADGRADARPRRHRRHGSGCSRAPTMSAW